MTGSEYLPSTKETDVSFDPILSNELIELQQSSRRMKGNDYEIGTRKDTWICGDDRRRRSAWSSGSARPRQSQPCSADDGAASDIFGLQSHCRHHASVDGPLAVVSDEAIPFATKTRAALLFLRGPIGMRVRLRRQRGGDEQISNQSWCITPGRTAV